MKLVVATTSYPRLDAMHAGIFIAQWRQALETQGIEVKCLRPAGSIGPTPDIEYPTWGSLLTGGGAPDKWFASPIRGTISGAIQSAFLYQQIRTHGSKGQLFVGHWLLPWGLFLPKGVPSHLYAHGSDIAVLESMPLMLARRITRRIDSNVDGITFVSQHLKTRYLAMLGRSPRSVLSTLTMGVFECERDEKLSREILAFKGTKTLALAMGRHVHLKGLDLLIRSAQNINELCLVVGGTGAETAQLRSLAHTLNVDVRFTGPFSPAQRCALLESADVFIQPSRQVGARQEGCPVTVLEAINQGVPCFLSETQGHLDLGQQGTIDTFPCDDIDVLTSLLTKLCSDSNYKRRLKRQAAEFKHSLSWENHVLRHEAELRRSMGSGSELLKPQSHQI
jgi:glycosyltransferase involved in cell wall biosynthesis